MALQALPEKANQISGLMITAVAGGGVVTPVMGGAIGSVGIAGGLLVVLACVLYLTYCAFGIKVAADALRPVYDSYNRMHSAPLSFMDI